MSEETQSLYPPPPVYFEYFNEANIAQLRQLRADGVSDDEIAQQKDIRFLIPPNAPAGETYRSFGNIWFFKDKQPTLTESGVAQLYSDENMDNELLSPTRIQELKKLIKGLLLNYLELVGIMAVNPKEGSKKVEQIQIILLNIHHLLNSYRLHQSREALILKYEEKVREAQDDAVNIRQTCEEVRETIRTLVLQSKEVLQNAQALKESKVDIVAIARKEAEAALLKEL
ncbi:mediator complex subunit [Martiniozyma asiatica (nom. inval.)]|nr:mediator complex subunit [Martiniozyma asiatica]